MGITPECADHEMVQIPHPHPVVRDVLRVRPYVVRYACCAH